MIIREYAPGLLYETPENYNAFDTKDKPFRATKCQTCSYHAEEDFPTNYRNGPEAQPTHRCHTNPEFVCRGSVELSMRFYSEKHQNFIGVCRQR